jgi:hypothetical protein
MDRCHVRFGQAAYHRDISTGDHSTVVSKGPRSNSSEFHIPVETMERGEARDVVVSVLSAAFYHSDCLSNTLSVSPVSLAVKTRCRSRGVKSTGPLSYLRRLTLDKCEPQNSLVRTLRTVG